MRGQQSATSLTCDWKVGFITVRDIRGSHTEGFAKNPRETRVDDTRPRASFEKAQFASCRHLRAGRGQGARA